MRNNTHPENKQYLPKI